MGLYEIKNSPYKNFNYQQRHSSIEIQYIFFERLILELTFVEIQTVEFLVCVNNLSSKIGHFSSFQSHIEEISDASRFTMTISSRRKLNSLSGGTLV